MNPFTGARSATLNVAAANTVIDIPAGFAQMLISTRGVVADDIVFAQGAVCAVPGAGAFTTGTIVNRGSVQAFTIPDTGGQYAFTPFAAGGIIGITLGSGE